MRERKKKESLNMWERMWGGGGGRERERERERDLISFNFLVITFKVLIA